MKKISGFIIFSFVIASIFFVKNMVSATLNPTGNEITGSVISGGNAASYTVTFLFSGTLDSGDIVYVEVRDATTGVQLGTFQSTAGGETNQTFNFNTTALADGAITLSGSVVNSGVLVTGSNVTSTTVKDTTNPGVSSLTLITPNGGEYLSGGHTYEITWNSGYITDPNLGATPISLEYSADGGGSWTPIANSESNDGTYTWTVPNIDSIIVLVSIVATDTAGNTGFDWSSNAFTIDSTPPTVDAGTNKYKNEIFTQDATVTDTGGIASYVWSKISGTGNITFWSGFIEDAIISASEDLTYVIQLLVTDTAGNTGTDTMTLVWDTTFPTFTGASNGAYYNVNKSITFDDTNLSGAILNDVAYISGEVISTTGVKTFMVYDLAGNSTGVTFTIDTTAPTTPNLLLSGYLNTGTANLLRSASTDTNMSGYIWQLSTGSDFATIYSSGSVTATGTTITGLTDTTYFYQVYAFDKAGNTGSRNSGSFIVDTIAPTLSGAAAVTNLTSQTPSYSFTSDETGTITYSGSCSSATTTAISGTQTIVFNSLSNATYTNCQFKVTDTAANASSGLTIPTFTVNYTAPSGGGGGGGSISKDVCLSGDLSPSLYDRTCEASGSSTGALHGRQRYTGSIIGSTYPTEWNNAYLYARGIGITTMNSIQQADMEGGLIRAHMAKMMVNYAITVLKRAPNTGALCIFDDVVHQSAEMKFYIKLACQLGLMGVGITDFNPNGGVTRAEFGTVLSRALYGNTYNTTGSMYYTNHLNALKANNIITNTNPWLKEIRGYVMLMLMRAGE